MSLYSSIDVVDDDDIDIAYHIGNDLIRLWIINGQDKVEMTVNEAKVLINKLETAIYRASL